MKDIIDIDKGNIGIKLSGGADSSIVYYAICEKYKNNNDVNIIPVTLDTNLKFWYVHTAKKVIAKVGELTGKYPIEHVTDKVTHSEENYVNGQERLRELVVDKYNTVEFFSGVTYNPDIAKMKEYFRKNHTKLGLDYNATMKGIQERDKSRDPKTIKPTATHYEPLIDKIDCFETYKKYGVIDSLYPVTFSCENTYKQKLSKLKHCGTCFFCLERYFAFGRIV